VFTKQAFGGGEAVAREVFVVKADGTGLTRVTTNVAEERLPRWVP
jgi:Tol biopolymer transport system component